MHTNLRTELVTPAFILKDISILNIYYEIYFHFQEGHGYIMKDN
jgi:hypothetical protein